MKIIDGISSTKEIFNIIDSHFGINREKDISEWGDPYASDPRACAQALCNDGEAFLFLATTEEEASMLVECLSSDLIVQPPLSSA